MLAYDYPLLGMFWTIAIVFFWVAWIMLLFRIIGDIFRNSDTGGVAKAGWLLFVIIIPWLGALVYVLSQGDGMASRTIERAQEQDAAMRSYIAGAAGTQSAAEEIAKLDELRNKGVLTADEFEQQKARLLTS